MKSLFQMTYTIRMVRPRQFIEPGLGVSTYLGFGARLFSTQWPPYGAHILQGLLRYPEPDGQTDGRTFRLIESIGPEGRCFENYHILFFRQKKSGISNTKQKILPPLSLVTLIMVRVAFIGLAKYGHHIVATALKKV